MNGLETKEPLVRMPEVISACGVPYGFVFNQKFTNFGEVKKAMHGAISAHNVPNDQVLRQSSDNELLFGEILEENAQMSDVQNPSIDAMGDFVRLYHLTDDTDEIVGSLESDNILGRPINSHTWATRCFGAGLACFTDLRQARERNGKKLVSIKVPYEQSVVIHKQAYWSSLASTTSELIKDDPSLHDSLNALLEISEISEIRNELEGLFKKLTAFNFASYGINTLGAIVPGSSTKSISESVQGNFVDNNGEVVEHFGYRTYMDERFLDPSFLTSALVFAAKGLKAEDIQHIENSVRKVLTNVQSRPNMYMADTYTGYNGIFDPSSELFQKFLICQLSLHQPYLRKLFQSNSDKSRAVLDVLDGFFPMNKDGNSLASPSLVIGTDLGSNNVAILRHFDPNTMSYSVVE